MHDPSSSSTVAGLSSPTRLPVDINAAAVNKPLRSASSISKKIKHALPPTDLQSIVGFSSKQRAFLTKAGFTTTQELLWTPVQTLSEKLKTTQAEAEEYLRIVTRERSARFLNRGSVASLLRDKDGDTDQVHANAMLKTGDEGIDEVLGGGLRPGSLTEFAGEASSGKTAFALQTAIRGQFPIDQGGLAGSCAYLCSEGNFPSTRLVDIAIQQARQLRDTSVQDLTDNVHLFQCAEVEDLLHAVRYHLPALVERMDKSVLGGQKPVKLVIVDSIAAPFRGTETSGPSAKGKERAENQDDAGYSFAQRNAHLHEIATSLHRLALRHGLCVVLINQVSDVFGYNDNRANGNRQDERISHTRGGIPLEYRDFSLASRYFSGEDAGKGGKMAVFGLPWANLIQVRLMLSRTGRRRRRVPPAALEDDQTEDKIDIYDLPPVDEEAEDQMMLEEPGSVLKQRMGEVQTVEVRRASVIFSPFAERGYIDYVLRQRGLVSIGQAVQQPRTVPGGGGGGGGKTSSQQRQQRLSAMDEEAEDAALWDEAGASSSDVEVIPATAGMDVEI